MVHDIRLETDASLPLTFSFITGDDLILQRVAVRLRTFLGEWALDTSRGLPYLAFRAVKPPDLDAIGAVIRGEILGVDGVLRIEDWTASHDLETRCVAFTGTVILESEAEATLTVTPFGEEGNTSPAVVLVDSSPIAGGL